jgi:hypothetical protein
MEGKVSDWAWNTHFKHIYAVLKLHEDLEEQKKKPKPQKPPNPQRGNRHGKKGGGKVKKSSNQLIIK